MMRKYNLKFAEGARVDASFLDFADALFAELDLTPERAQLAVDRWQGYVGKRIEAEMLQGQAAADHDVADLKKSWGKDFDARIAAGKKAVKSLGLNASELDALEQSIGLAPVMNLFARLGQHMSMGGTGPATPEQAARTIEDLKGDKSFQKALRDKNDPKHADSLRQWEAAHAAAFPAKDIAAAATTTSAPPGMPAAPNSKSRADALAEIEQLRGDSAFQDTLRNQSSPNRAAALDRWESLHAAAFAPEQQGTGQ